MTSLVRDASVMNVGRKFMTWLVACVAAAILAAPSVRAADRPAVGPAPAWVLPAPLPAAPEGTEGAAIVQLLLDQQSRLTDTGDSAYFASVIRIGAPQALPAAALNLTWDPALETLTLHRFAIVRDGKTLDLLGDGSKLTIVRRETNLERATLDGQLTATVQPDDVRVGDIVDLAVTRTRLDPALRGRSQALLGVAPSTPYGRIRVRVLWPAGKKIAWRAAPGVLEPREGRSGSDRELLYDRNGLTPAAPPLGAPPRFWVTNMVAASDMGGWPEVSRLMAPLYETAAKVPATGPLRDEVTRIAALSADPKVRALAALKLVQEQVRYVLLAMDGGGYMPAAATLTWTRRYGDCKGKTVLLIALLRELGIAARPALVSTDAGDGLEARLPMIGAFDHVLVEATLAGRTYWLDGTRPGDRMLETIRTPLFKWALPVTTGGAGLVALTPDAPARPDQVRTLDLDASAGLDAPAKARGEHRFEGDAALGLRLGLGQMAAVQRDQTLRSYWRGEYDFVTPVSVAMIDEPATGSVRLTMTGTAKLAWELSNGHRWYSLDGSRVGQTLSIAREPGPNADAPFAVQYPAWSENRQTLTLPQGGQGFIVDGGDVDATAGPFRIVRKVRKDGARITLVASTRTLAPEVAFGDAPGVKTALAKLYERAVSAGAPTALNTAPPTTAEGLMTRASERLDARDLPGALADADAAVALTPNSARAHGVRAVVLAWQRDPRAEAAAVRSEALDAKEPGYLHARITAAELAGRLADAEAAATRNLQILPDDGFALERRAQLRLKSGNPAGALADADRLVKLRPGDNAANLLRIGVLLVQSPDAGRAAHAAYLKANPENEAARLAMPTLLAFAGRNPEALAAADALVAADPGNDEVLHSRALFRLRLGDKPGGMTDFATLIARSPSFAYLIERSQLWNPKDRARWTADLDAAAKLEPENPAVPKARAVMEMRDEKFDAATGAIDAAAKLEPADPQLAALRRDLAARRNPPQPATAIEFERRAGTRLDKADYTGALADADAAVALNPKSSRAHAIRSVALAWLDDPRSEAAAAMALSIDPKDAAPWHARAIAAEAADRAADAEAALTTALAIWPQDEFAFFRRARLRKARGDRDGALADIDAKLKLSPGDSFANLLRLQIVSRDDPTALVAAHAEYLKSRPDDLLAQRLFPAALASAGRVAEAIVAMDAFIAAHPEDEEALYQRARLRMRAGDRSGAAADLDRVLILAPDADRHLERAQLRNREDRAGWEGDLAAAAKLGLDQASLWRARGALELRVKNYDAASAALDKAAKLAPKSVHLRELRRALLIRQGRGAEVLAQMDAELTPSAEALNSRCWTRATLNVQLDRALDDCEAALRLQPLNAGYLDSRALVHFRAGRFARAIADYDAALKTNPGIAASLFGRGLTRAAMGGDGSADFAAARAIFPQIDDEFASWNLTATPAKKAD